MPNTFMDADLARSGLVAADLDATPSSNPFGAGSLYRIPYYLPDGNPHPIMHRGRLEIPAAGHGKYTQPSAAAYPNAAPGDLTYPYLNPRVLQRGPTTGLTWEQVGAINRALHPNGLLFTGVEGEKKAVAVGKYCGRMAFGFGGCWNAVFRDAEGVYRVHPVLTHILRPGDRLELIFDADIHTNPEVQRAAGSTRRAFMRIGVRVIFITVPRTGSGLGIDDWLMTIPAANRAAEFERLPRATYDRGELLEDRVSLIDYLKLPTNDGKLICNESTALAVFNRHERYADRLWIEDSLNVMMESVGGDTPKEVTDAFIAKQVAWFQENISHAFKQVAVKGGFNSLANSDKRHRNAVHDYMDRLKWDGKPRLETMFIRGWGADDTLYIRAIGKAWMVGVVARAYRPGCDMQAMLVLEGAQGIGKSRSLKALGGPWYVETNTIMGSKDFILEAHKSLIFDIAELGAYKYADFAQVKGLLTTSVDVVRSPYAANSESRPRRFVFVATTNEDHYLRDMTGNRRFWPIACGPVVDVDWVKENRDQLFAEAKVCFETGAQWWVDDAITGPVLDQRIALDPWEDALDSALVTVMSAPPIVLSGTPYYFIATSMLLEAMKVTSGGLNAGHYMRLAAIIKKSRPDWLPYRYDNVNAPLNVGSVMKDKVRGYRCPVTAKHLVASIPAAPVIPIVPIAPAANLAPPPSGDPFMPPKHGGTE